MGTINDLLSASKALEIAQGELILENPSSFALRPITEALDIIKKFIGEEVELCTIDV